MNEENIYNKFVFINLYDIILPGDIALELDRARKFMQSGDIDNAVLVLTKGKQCP